MIRDNVAAVLVRTLCEDNKRTLGDSILNPPLEAFRAEPMPTVIHERHLFLDDIVIAATSAFEQFLRCFGIVLPNLEIECGLNVIFFSSNRFDNFCRLPFILQ